MRTKRAEAKSSRKQIRSLFGGLVQTRYANKLLAQTHKSPRRNCLSRWPKREFCGCGIKITQRLLGKTLACYIPLFGAAAVASYAYADTRKVGQSAMAMFRKEVVIVEDNPSSTLGRVAGG